MVVGCGDKVDKVLPERQATHSPEMDANENSGYWFHIKPLPGTKEWDSYETSCSLIPMMETSSSGPGTTNPSLGHKYLLFELPLPGM